MILERVAQWVKASYSEAERSQFKLIVCSADLLLIQTRNEAPGVLRVGFRHYQVINIGLERLPCCQEQSLLWGSQMNDKRNTKFS